MSAIKPFQPVSHGQGHPRVLYSLAPQRAISLFSRKLGVEYGFEVKADHRAGQTLAFSLIPLGAMVHEAGETQRGQLSPLGPLGC